MCLAFGHPGHTVVNIWTGRCCHGMLSLQVVTIVGQQNTCVRYAFNSSVELGGDDAWQADWEERRHEG